MRQHMAQQAEETQRAGTPAIDLRDLANERDGGGGNDGDIDDGARRHSRDDRDTLGGIGDEAMGFEVERRHKFALCELDKIRTVDDGLAVARKIGAGTGGPRVRCVQTVEVGDDRQREIAVVLHDGVFRAGAQAIDAAEAAQREEFADDEDENHKREDRREAEADITEPEIAGEQVLDQARDAKAEAEGDQTAERGPEQGRKRRTLRRGRGDGCGFRDLA